MRSAKSSKRMTSKQSGGKRVSKKSKAKKSKSKSKGKLGAGMCYCVKCKKGITPVGGSKKTYPNGRCAMTGHCPACNTKVFKFCKC